MKAVLLALCALAAAGCAKFPNLASGQHVHLVFRMTVAGQINPNYIYLVAVNPSIDLNPTVQGPIPVVAAPWGNGLLAGNATHFIRYDPTQTSPYTIYRFITPDLLQFQAIGAPVNSVPPGETGSTLEFEIDMAQIAPSNFDPDTYNSVQVNFMTMNRRPLGGDPGSKVWDALGDSRDPNSVNDYIRVPLTSSRLFSNAGPEYQDIEVQGDTPSPDLDIVNWSVEVRKP